MSVTQQFVRRATVWLTCVFVATTALACRRPGAVGCHRASANVQVVDFPPRSPEPEAGAPRTVVQFVDQIAGLPLVRRRVLILRYARSLESGWGDFGFQEYMRQNFQGLVVELIRRSDYSAIEALDADIGPLIPTGASGRLGKRAILHWEMHSARPRPKASLARLAQLSPSSIPLAVHRPGGIQFLLGVVENVQANVHDRAHAAGLLGYHGSPELVPRLKLHENDRSPYDTGWGPPLRDRPPTLGDRVRLAIKSIEARTRSND